MKNFLISIFLIIAIGFPLQLLLPWWSIAMLTIAVGFLIKFDNSLWSFIAGFLAVLLLWSGYAAYLDMSNAHILSQKMGNLFGNISSGGVIALTGIIGGLVGGFFAMTGTLGRKLIGPN